MTKKVPLVAKNWTIFKSDGTIETASKKEAYPENFRILSQKTPKRVTFRRPYLRKLFPFVKTGTGKNIGFPEHCVMVDKMA